MIMERLSPDLQERSEERSRLLANAVMFEMCPAARAGKFSGDPSSSFFPDRSELLLYRSIHKENIEIKKEFKQLSNMISDLQDGTVTNAVNAAIYMTFCKHSNRTGTSAGAGP